MTTGSEHPEQGVHPDALLGPAPARALLTETTVEVHDALGLRLETAEDHPSRLITGLTSHLLDHARDAGRTEQVDQAWVAASVRSMLSAASSLEHYQREFEVTFAALEDDLLATVRQQWHRAALLARTEPLPEHLFDLLANVGLLLRLGRQEDPRPV